MKQGLIYIIRNKQPSSKVNILVFVQILKRIIAHIIYSFGNNYRKQKQVKPNNT